MKINSGIITLIGLIISNASLAQDSTHERLVDKYYPKAEQAPPVPKTEKLNPVTTSTTQPAAANAPVTAVPLQATVTPPATSASEPLNEIINEVVPVTQTTSQVQSSQSPINNEVGKINKSTDSTKKGIDNYNSNPASPIYRDTRLGSSSPMYNTYEKNNNGAGSVTTNPNKG
jgi:hypothetical protein